jgi:hypothetical protein
MEHYQYESRGVVVSDEDGADDPQSSLLCEFHPDPDSENGSQPRVDLILSAQADTPGYDTGTQRGATPFYTSKRQASGLLTGLHRPATNLAYKWLATDLRTLGWVTDRVQFHD